MATIEDEEFNNVFNWAIQEEQKNIIRRNQGAGVNTVYLIGIAILIFTIVFFILYISNRKRKLTALQLMNDPNNVFDEFSQNQDEDAGNDEENDEAEGENNEGENSKNKGLPMIDISEDNLPVSEEPKLDNILEPGNLADKPDEGKLQY